MAWNDPGLIFNTTVVTAEYLNKFIDSLLYVRSPNDYYADNLAAFTTTSTTWASLGANYEATINVSGSSAHVLVMLEGNMRVDTTASGVEAFLDVEIDSVRKGNVNRGLMSVTQYNNAGTSATNGNLLFHTNFMQIFTGLSAGNHTFKIFGKTGTSGRVFLINTGHHVVIKEV